MATPDTQVRLTSSNMFAAPKNREVYFGEVVVVVHTNQQAVHHGLLARLFLKNSNAVKQGAARCSGKASVSGKDKHSTLMI